MNDESVVLAKDHLIKNTQSLPMPLVSQWMHEAYIEMRNSHQNLDSKGLSKYYLKQVFKKYTEACLRDSHA